MESSTDNVLQSVMDELVRLHTEVDREAARLTTKLGERIRCGRGCFECCVDELTVFEIEAVRIREHAATLLQEEAPHPPGLCAFLGFDGACRIYPVRPYVCRTQGLPFRWFEDLDEGTPAEMRDICPLNEEGDPIEMLARDACWTIGPFEERLARLQERAADGARTRVRLRNLFGK